MPVYQYEGQHFELPDGLSNEQAIAKIKGHLGQKDEPSVGDKSIGILEAGASQVAGLPSQIAGGLYGLGSLMSGKGIDKANEDMQRVMESNFGFGAYKPATETGKRYAENAGEFMNKPIEWAGQAGEALGGNTGRLAGELGAGTLMALVDPLAALGVGKAMTRKPRPGNVDRPAPDLSKVEAALTDVQTPRGPEGTQGDLFGFQNTEGMATPYDAGQMGVSEPVTPMRARRQMELPVEPDALIADSNGVITKTPQDEATQLARARMEETPPLDVNQATQGDLFEPYTNSHREFDQFGNEQKPLTFDEYKQTVENLAKEPSTGFKAPEDLEQGFKQYQESLQPGLFDTGTRQNEFKEAVYQDTVPQRASEHPFVKAAEERVGKAERMVEKLKADVESGKVVPTVLARALKDLENLQTKATTARTNVEGALRTRGDMKPFSNSKSKQAGKLYIGERKKKEPDFFKANMKAWLPDERTSEEFLAQEKNTPDISQNMVQRGINYLTKGGDYVALKTASPLIKKVVDRVLDANNAAKAKIGELVHDLYAPAAREMNSKERTEIFSALQLAEIAGKEVSPEVLRDAGFNEKQIKYAELHQRMSNETFAEANRSLVANGKPPIDRRTAYVATRMTGDFRRGVYRIAEDGEKTYVGGLGSNTRYGLNRQVEQMKELAPHYEIGEERYFGGSSKSGLEPGFNQMLEFLSQNDPHFKEFVKKVNEISTQDAYNYMNAKAHTKEKKGVFGTEGNKLFKNAEQNAKEGIEAQIRYAETMIKWSELSKAIEDVKPLMDEGNGLNMPNAKAYLKDYIDNALGRNPTAVGRALDTLGSEFGKATGIGTTIPGKVMSGAKSLVNGLLLGWGNVPFLMTNAVQSLKVMPEMQAFLESKGAKTTLPIASGYSYMAQAAIDTFKHNAGKPVDSIMTGAMKYAKDNHVYSSDLFESGNSVSKDVGYYWNKGTQAGAAQIEQSTRKNMFLSMTKFLHDQGITPEDGLYHAARKLTDKAMNDYNNIESPMAYNAAGGLGRLSSNLMSYKHNELSRLSMFAREAMKDKDAKPLLTAIVSQVAFAGIKGTILYAEADWLIKQISEKLGKPTSLTKMLLESKMPDALKFGLFNYAGVDMTSRLGMQVAPSGNSAAEMAGNLAFPGGSKLVNMAGAAGKAVGTPNEYNIKNAIREAAPNSVAGALDRAWFSGQGPQGEELSMNRNKAEANATRNDTDKVWKTFGATGINESKQKMARYENDSIDRAYQDRRTSVMNQIAQNYFTSGKVDQELIDKYIKAEGDPNTLVKDITDIPFSQKLTGMQRAQLRNAASTSITAMKRLERANK